MFKRKFKPHFGKLSIILLVVVAVLVAADLLTKHFEEITPWNAVIIPGFAEIQGGGLHRNRGCAFSFLDQNPNIGQPIFITLTFVLIAVLALVFIFLPERFKISKTAIAIVVAGAIGNLVDRIMFYEVRDWFGLWMFGGMVFCNLADFFVVIGAFLAVLDILFLNEYSVFPLTKKAKAAAAARKEKEDREEEKKLKETQDAEDTCVGEDKEE